MACSATLTGITRDCVANRGGIKKVYFANADDVVSVSLSNGEISAITMDTGKKFKGYYQKPNQASMTSTPQFNDMGDYAGEQTILSLVFPRQDTAKRVELAALSVVELCAIVEDMNGKYWYLGYDNPVLRNGGESGTGAAATDSNKYGMDFVDNSNEFPYEIDSTIISGIVD